jgi:hypothetical protein
MQIGTEPEGWTTPSFALPSGSRRLLGWQWSPSEPASQVTA